MKQFFTFLMLFVCFNISAYSQEYWWVLKQSGGSLGGPADYNTLNTDLVYYGSGSIVYKSTDRGETFSITGTSIPSASQIKCIILDDNNPGTLLAAVESSPNDKIYKSTNDGATWALTLDEGQMSYFGIPMEQDAANPNVIFTMINTNFKKSTDFGTTWATISSNFGPSSAPCDIAVFPGTNTILIGDNGTGIFKSTDYGLTWNQTYFTGGEIPTISVDTEHPGTAWATKWGGSQGVVKSTDYGTTWVSQSTFNGYSMWGVHVQPTDGDLVIAGCYSCGYTWRTKNGGLTWTMISTPSSDYQTMVIDSMTQFAIQGNGIYKLASNYFIPVELTSFAASIVNNEVILNWSTATELNNSGFEIERSFDNQQFEKIGFVPGFGTTTEVRNYYFRISDVPAAAQYYRLKQIDYDGTFTYSGSVEVEGIIPSEFSLAQNHPNPFNPSTKINFTLPVESNVYIKFFNLLGQEVDKIIVGEITAGTHEVNFNAASLSSGTYIYILEAKGINGQSFRDSKKMILLR